MGKTIIEKILSAHADTDKFRIGDIIKARVDFAFANDITAPIAIKYFKVSGAKQVFDKKRVGLIPDHFTPNKDIKSAEQCKLLKEFAQEYEIENYFEIGKMGIEHALLPEKGLVLPEESFDVIDPKLGQKCDRFITDSIDEAMLFDLMGYSPLGLPHVDCETGEMLAGLKPGRENKDQIIICNNIGMAVDDLAVAKAIYDNALVRKVGTILPT